ncbi:RNA polymerase sigma factor [Tenacibaculum aiptasiae]|uniref:RNA polymerase sigma factor n=1 Tax=Tenacibaculum aiptasiae TaxID=426481 RepID=UPI00232EFBBA|nr:sigma-70 family RNA polymerase sigma factor [Tenacibaculum aiptasiae]
MNNKDKYFTKVYEHSKDKIYRISLGFMGNEEDANDLFQEVLIKIWNNLGNFREESSIDTWIYRITTNTALAFINKTKKLKNKHTNVIPENLKAEPINTKSVYDQEKVNKLYQAIASLKKIDRIIISLILEETSYNEVANITGISISNVGVRVNRIKKKLAKKIK